MQLGNVCLAYLEKQQQAIETVTFAGQQGCGLCSAKGNPVHTAGWHLGMSELKANVKSPGHN